jgi:folate-binding protein YgfZ
VTAEYRSPLLDHPGAVAASPPDAAVPAHYGDPFGEQRLLESGAGFVDLSHRDVVTIAGPDRLTWLHGISTQHLEALPPGASTTTLVLSPQGHVEYVLYLVDDGDRLWVSTEPGAGAGLGDFLRRMVFMLRVTVEDLSDELGVVWFPGAAPAAGADGVARDEAGRPVRQGADSLGGYEAFRPPTDLPALAAATRPAGTWALEARRIAAGVPRVGLEADERAIPNELGWIGPAVHLDKGCYRGQETVARVHTLGRPPRRLVLLHLDGSADDLPAHGAAITVVDATDAKPRDVGFVGSAVRHHELGPIALGVVKRNVPTDLPLLVAGQDGPVAAAQEVVVQPDVGLHVRARLR